MFPRILLLTGLILTFSSATFGLYFVVDYFMDHGFPKMFGQSCDDYVQDDCVYINSHLNTFEHWDYRGHVRCKMTLDAGKQRNATYKVKWHRFKVEATNCSDDKDYLEFHDASLDHYDNDTRIGRYCGWTYPSPNLTSYLTQRYFTIVWRTDGIREDKGWRFMATRILPYPCPDSDYFHCKAENVCMDGRLKCDGISQCDDGEDESDCSTWEKMIGGFLALGTAGVTGVSGACLFGCIVGWVILGCVCNRCKKDSTDTVIVIEGGEHGSGGENDIWDRGNGKDTPGYARSPDRMRSPDHVGSPDKSGNSTGFFGKFRNLFGISEASKNDSNVETLQGSGGKPPQDNGNKGGVFSTLRMFGARGARVGQQKTTPTVKTDTRDENNTEKDDGTTARPKTTDSSSSATAW